MSKFIFILLLAAPLLSACEKPIPKPPKPIASVHVTPALGTITS
jgi:hypothetical protein